MPSEIAGDTRPLDIATMRKSIGRLLPPGVEPLDNSELTVLVSLMRGHMELVIPEVQAAAVKLPEDDIPRYCALACLGEARGRLAAQPSPVPGGEAAYARRLARSLNALVDHYEALTGVTRCLAYDQPLCDGEASRQYDHVGLSDCASGSARIHERCVDSVHRR